MCNKLFKRKQYRRKKMISSPQPINCSAVDQKKKCQLSQPDVTMTKIHDCVGKQKESDSNAMKMLLYYENQTSNRQKFNGRYNLTKMAFNYSKIIQTEI